MYFTKRIKIQTELSRFPLIPFVKRNPAVAILYVRTGCLGWWTKKKTRMDEFDLRFLHVVDL